MKIIDIRNSVTSFLQIIQENKQKENFSNSDLVNKPKYLRGTSFLQVENSNEKTPKLQCSCKFIKSSKDFLENDMANLKINSVSSKAKTGFIQMKVKENLINKNKSKILGEKNGN
jgi:hypothetical protein